MLLYRQIGAKIAYYRTLEGMSQEELRVLRAQAEREKTKR